MPDMRRLVFDNVEWDQAGGDVGDNSQFWHPATIISVDDDGEIATVRFEHNQRISDGHFIYAMRRLDDGPPLPPCDWCGSTFHGHYPDCPELDPIGY